MRMSAFAIAVLLGSPFCQPPATQPSTCENIPLPSSARVLVFTKTTGFRHESIPVAVEAIRGIGLRNGFAVEHTENSSVFADTSLARFAAVVFLNTTGDVLDDAQQSAFERFIRAGGGFAGIHSAADTEYAWPWYGQLMGAWFKSHPAIQQATVRIETPSHPSTRCLAQGWVRTDEWYDFQARPAASVTILATVDESSYANASMGEPHPVAWYHAFDGGRAWYTAMGHTTESWADSTFTRHVAGGILWAAAR
jgi:type 1 glutamine amidotransferase